MTREAARFITFEGSEGTGKSTQIERLERRLRAHGVAPLVTREPGGTEVGRLLRDLLLRPSSEPIDAEVELLLYTADRHQHLARVVEPALRGGNIVLCDRYLDATLAYQGHARGLGFSRVLELHRHPPLDRRPDRTILLDLDPGVALSRARQRNRGLGVTASESRFEDERIEFHRRVREGYRELASREPSRIRTIEASGSPEEVEQRVAAELADLLPLLVGGAE